ncbi:MAG: long-chain fatty acid--CoA ligase [Desulfobacteraceae bacterium]|nr:MAG: long-chain fatty acid--CoA ligase [Desulfobacteraceae bacterium]
MESRPWQRHYDYDVPLSIRYPRIPVQNMLRLAAFSYPDKPALNFYGTETTFMQLHDQILRMANALGRLGVKKGDRVGIQLPTCPQYVLAYHASLYMGAIAVNLNPMYTPDELRPILENTGISTLFTFDMVLPNIRTVCRALELPPRVIVTRITDFIQGFGMSTPEELGLEEGWHHFSFLLEGCTDRRVPNVTIVPEDPALIQFTGGTTGIPKGAVLTHANLVAATLQITLWGKSTTGLTPAENRSVMAVLPYFHVYGTVVVMHWALFNCATQILVPRFEIEEFLDRLAAFDHITFLPAVPTLINAVINHPRAQQLALDRKLGLLNSGAAPMPVELIDQILEMGINYSEGWGMSETTSLGISNPSLGFKKKGSIGIPWPDTDVKLVDLEEGKEEVARGEPGEIMIRSPLVMRGYWNNPRETSGQMRDGWLYTGDIAVRDEDDYFAIVDRKKDMIIAGGYNIYPREIDEVLYRHPKILNACTIGVSDPYRGETVKAFIVPREGEDLTEQEVLDFCKEKLAPYKRPKIIEFRKHLPTSMVGKILRKQLRKEEEARMSPSPPR